MAPGDVFNLTNWKLTLPTNGAEEIEQPELDSFSDSNFFLNGSNEIVMVAPVEGETTSGSGATRCEFREMEGGTDEAAWSMATTGFRQLTVTGVFDPTGASPRKEMIVGQIHATGGTPPMYLAVEHHVASPRLRLFKAGSSSETVAGMDGLTASTVITYRIRISDGRVKLWAAKGTVADLPVTPQYDWAAADFTESTNCYLKAGSYNKSEVDASGAGGESTATISHIEMIQPADIVTQRLYITNVAPSFTPGGTPYPGDIQDSASITDAIANPRLLGTDPAGASASVSRTETSTLTSYVAMGRQFVSHPMSAAGTITGNWQLAIGGSESSTSADMRPYVQVWVTQGDSATLRGADAVVFAGGNSSLEFATSPAGRVMGSSVQTVVSFEADDRIVVEVSIYNTGGDDGEQTGTLYYGGTGSPDLASGTTDMSRPGWVELDVTPGVEFVAPPVTGTGSTALGALSASATGTPRTPGAAAASLGGLVSSATGVGSVPAVEGTASAGQGPDPDDFPAEDQYPSDDEYPGGGLPRGLGGLVAVAAGTTSILVDGTATTLFGVLRGAGTGEIEVDANATAGLGTLAASATGTRITAGSAAGLLGALNGSVTGTRRTSGSAVAPLSGLAGSATGRPQIVAAAAAELGGVSGTASGTRISAATADAALGTLHGAVTGNGTISGSATADFGTLSATGTGHRTTFGAGSSSLAGMTAAATGEVDVTAGAEAPLGSLTSAATGTVSIAGTAIGSLGPLTSSAAGHRTAHATAAAPLGGLAAEGASIPEGAGSAPLGGLTAAATASPGRHGVGSASLGALSSSTDGDRTTHGVASGTFGGLNGSSTGTITVVAVIAAPFGELASATAGTRGTTGAGMATLGALVALANGDDIAHVDGTAAAVLGRLRGRAHGVGFRAHVVPHAGTPSLAWMCRAGVPVVLSGPGAGPPAVVELVSAGEPEELIA